MNGRQEDPNAQVKRTSVLVVDDDEATCYVVERALQEAGVAVETAGDCDEGLAPTRAGAHDVVLLD